MFFKCKLTRSICLGIACFIVATMMVGCDESYDLSKLDGDVVLFQEGISAPLENDVEIELSQLLTSETTNDLIVVDEKGRYVLNFSGSIEPVNFDVPEVAFNEFDPTLASSHLDFFESLRKDPIIAPVLELLGYQGGALPDNDKLVVTENVVHAPIVDKKENYSFEIPGIPEEVVAVHSIKPHENTRMTLSLHAEGFPEDITHVTFEFILHAPSQMMLHPEEKDIYKDDLGYFHIEHDLPCINGKLDDVVHFYIDSLVFTPALQRRTDNSILIESELEYSGKIHINESFHLGGWTPQLDLNVGFKMDASTIDEVKATVQADIDDIELNEEIGSLPEVLTNPETRLDLQQVLLSLNINNNIPLGVNADVELQSKFYDGTTSPMVTTDKPLQILPEAQQQLVVTNDAQYAGATYLEKLDELVEKVPQSFYFKASPYVPATDLILKLGHTYSLALDYALNVPIILGKNLNLHYDVEVKDFAQTLRDVSTYFDCAKLEGVIESTLPINVTLKLHALDKDGNIMNEIKMSNPLEVKANKKSPFSIQLDILANDKTFDKLDKIILSVTGKTNSVGELRPEQKLKITKLSVSLPEGATLASEL